MLSAARALGEARYRASHDALTGLANRVLFTERVASGAAPAVVNTPETGRSPHHLNVRFPGVRNETLLMRLDQRGVAASAGSACQSGAATVSHVLEAMGLTPDQARESVRFTFGWASTMDEAMAAGHRSAILQSLFATQRGWVADHDWQQVGQRFLDPVPDGKFKGFTIARWLPDMVRSATLSKPSPRRS